MVPLVGRIVTSGPPTLPEGLLGGASWKHLVEPGADDGEDLFGSGVREWLVQEAVELDVAEFRVR